MTICVACVGLAVCAHPGLASGESAGEQPASSRSLAGQRADVAPRTSPQNRWRYSYHNGHWWYYREGGRWAYWTGSQWRDYDAKTYRRWYVNQKMADYNAELARFDARTMGPYVDNRFQDGSLGFPGYGVPGYLVGRSGRYFAAPALSGQGGGYGGGSDMFYPRAFDGRLNPATSTGGYMGGALRGPFGY